MAFDVIKSYAKINLALNITGKKKLLHKVESIIAFVDLYDLIKIKQVNSNNHNISFKGKFSKGIGSNNTVSKLIKLLEKKKLLKNKKFNIEINKKIPQKAGLGGGSMNAGNLLKFFVKKRIIKISQKQIISILNSIGSDVILSLNSTNSILTSKNQIKYFLRCKKFHVLIVKPNFGCSTKNIYSKVRKFSKPKFNKPNIKMFRWDYLTNMNNSLESISFKKFPQLRKIKSYTQNLSKPSFVRMTGSGSALVAYFISKKKCKIDKKKFIKRYKNYWCISSKTI